MVDAAVVRSCADVTEFTYKHSGVGFIMSSCQEYTPSTVTQTALVVCSSQFFEAPIDTDQIAPLTLMHAAGHELLGPRLVPEGDEVFVTDHDISGQTATVEHYLRSGTDWVRAPSPVGLRPTTSNNDVLDIGPPTRMLPGGRRLMLHYLTGGESTFEEYVEATPNMWMGVVGGTYDHADFGVDTLAFPSLTDDGLHLVFTANAPGFMNEQVRLAGRGTLDDRFGTSTNLDTVFAHALYPYITANCSRLYLSSVDSISYVDP
jgi:hypothetical protein